MKSVYLEKEHARLVEAGKYTGIPYAEPYSVVEVHITDDGEIWSIFLGRPGTMITEGELDLWSMLSEDKKKEVALNWRNTRATHTRVPGDYPHRWVK